jgi:hypothetical protein
MTKRTRSQRWQPEPLPLDPRDPDIVRAKELDRRSRDRALTARLAARDAGA